MVTITFFRHFYTGKFRTVIDTFDHTFYVSACANKNKCRNKIGVLDVAFRAFESYCSIKLGTTQGRNNKWLAPKSQLLLTDKQCVIKTIVK